MGEEDKSVWVQDELDSARETDCRDREKQDADKALAQRWSEWVKIIDN